MFNFFKNLFGHKESVNTKSSTKSKDQSNKTSKNQQIEKNLETKVKKAEQKAKETEKNIKDKTKEVKKDIDSKSDYAEKKVEEKTKELKNKAEKSVDNIEKKSDDIKEFFEKKADNLEENIEKKLKKNETSTMFTSPKEDYSKLLKELSAYFKTNENIKQAWLRLMIDGKGEKLLLVIDSKNDFENIEKESLKIAESNLKNQKLNITEYNDFGASAVTISKPFYLQK